MAEASGSSVDEFSEEETLLHFDLQTWLYCPPGEDPNAAVDLDRFFETRPTIPPSSASEGGSAPKKAEPPQAVPKPESEGVRPFSLSSVEKNRSDSNDIPLAREDVANMALTLDDKIENVPIQAVVKECVRTSSSFCHYCRHAVKIAVNGKELALHLLSEHRYTPVKNNEANEDVVRKLKNSLDALYSCYLSAETYEGSDPAIHIPYDKESNYKCLHCTFHFLSHKDLYIHVKKRHTKSWLLCIMCKKTFLSYSELICHLCPGTYNPESQLYSVDMNFRCCFCRLDTIPSAFELMEHLRKSHHTCDICLEMCSDQQKLSTHTVRHKLNNYCYRCGIAYALKEDMKKHMYWKHGNESVHCKKCLQKKWPYVYHFCIPPTSFICEECNKSFSKAVGLKVHKRIHGNDYPYTCPQCEKKFVSKKLLAWHVDRHNAVLQKKDSPQHSFEENPPPTPPPTKQQKPALPVPQSPSLREASGSGLKTVSTRLSKRRRVPNKFYGYSSGEEEEKPKRQKTPKPEPVKADKDVYCYCGCPYDKTQKMIACDDKQCKYEWYHFECVGVSVPPRGQWFCPGCRRARSLLT